MVGQESRESPARTLWPLGPRVFVLISPWVLATVAKSCLIQSLYLLFPLPGLLPIPFEPSLRPYTPVEASPPLYPLYPPMYAPMSSCAPD
jgi:hypothetical protein